MKSAQLLFNIGKKLQLAFVWSLLPGLLMLIPPVVFRKYLLMDLPGILVIGGLTAVLMVVLSTMAHGFAVGGMCLLLNAVVAYSSLTELAKVLP